MSPSGATKGAVEYHLTKVDQAGEVSDLLEGQAAHVAKMFGLDQPEDFPESVILPDGRILSLYWDVRVDDPE